MHNTKTLKRVKSGPSKFDGILNKDVLSGKREIEFCFKSDSEKCYFPVNSSLYELINDGWEIVVKPNQLDKAKTNVELYCALYLALKTSDKQG